jgi:hypothetical protein
VPEKHGDHRPCEQAHQGNALHTHPEKREVSRGISPTILLEALGKFIFLSSPLIEKNKSTETEHHFSTLYKDHNSYLHTVVINRHLKWKKKIEEKKSTQLPHFASRVKWRKKNKNDRVRLVFLRILNSE